MISTSSANAALSRGPIFGRSWWVDVVFWLAYGLFWHVVFSPEIFRPSNLCLSAILTFWQAAATYAHQRFLLEPQFRKVISPIVYGFGAVALIFVTSLCSGGSVYVFFWKVLGDNALREFENTFVSYWTGAVLGGMSMAVAITGVIYLFVRRRAESKRSKELERAKTEAELAYLRGQLNPHFLFNALNSIYVLIPRSPEEAQTALSGFSDLLRYQLYRAEEDRVPLREEIAQLRKFVALSRLRLEEDFVFALGEPAGLAEQQIPPLLLLPLLENAVKYSPAHGARVTGMLEVTDGRLHFDLTNLVGPGKPVAVSAGDAKAGGIGLANIRRRLELLYPGNYAFTTEQRDDHYTVHLDIPLTPCPSAPSS